MTNGSKGLYFNADKLPNATEAYVCWIDVMGMGPTMSRSTKTAANFIFKLHTAVVNSQTDGVKLFPVMDGVYATSNDKDEILSFLISVFGDLAEEFIYEENNPYRFIPKGAVAYGPVIDGGNVGSGASRDLADEEEYKSSILLGIPVIQAFKSEDSAPPFGVHVHESARTFSSDDDDPMPYVWWDWFINLDLDGNLEDELMSYYEWCESNSNKISYPSEKNK